MGGARPVQLWLYSGTEDLTRKVAPDAAKRLAERLAGLPGMQVTPEIRPNLGPEGVLSVSLPALGSGQRRCRHPPTLARRRTG